MQEWQSAPAIGGQAPAQPAPQQRPVQQQPAMPRRIYGAPEAPKVPDAPKPNEVWRTMSSEEAAGMGLEPGGVYQTNGTGGLKVVQAPRKEESGSGNAIPQGAFEKADTYVGQYSSLRGSLETFQDDFAGNTVTGDLENFAQRKLGTGTPGQNQWWANFRALDNSIRNDLFGATLTPSEQRAYAQTSIDPSMDPKIIRENLKARSDIIEAALRRRKDFYLKNGYRPEAVNAIFSPLASGGVKTAGSSEGNAQLQQAFDGGASKEQLSALAAQLNVTLIGGDDQLDEMIAYRDSGGTGASFVSRDGGNEPPPPPEGPQGGTDPLASETFGEAGRALNAVGAVGGSGITFGLSDEAAGFGQALGGLLRGDTDVAANFEAGQSAEQARVEAGRDYLGVAALPVEIAGGGGALRIAGGVPQGLQAARRVAASGQPVTRQAIQSNLTRRAAGEGAVIGGVAGAAQGDTLQERGTNALIGTFAGGTLGALGQAGSNALANRAARTVTPGAGAEVQQAADNLGIDVIPAVTGGTTARIVTSGAKQGFVSARPIDKAVDRMTGQALSARENIADNVGQRLDAEDAGNVIRNAGKVFSERTSRIGGKLYDRVEKFGGGQQFPLTSGVAKADEWLADLGRSVQGKDGTIYKEVKALRDKMAAGQFDVMSIPRTRDEFRSQLQERGLRGSTLDTAIGQILREAEQDILNGLQASGNTRAVGAFKTASEFWKKRVETIDDFFSPILGKNAPKSGEQVVTALERLANPQTGNASQLVGIMKAMPPREANSVRATIINRMGTATPGAAVDKQAPTFSFDTFMTNWNNMSPRAKAAMFPPEHRAAINDLAKVAEAVKAAGSSANRSNTAGALTTQGVISTLGWWALEPLQLGSGLVAQYAVGRLMASPKFARMLARAPRQNTPQAKKAFSAQLGNLAKAEPALAREIGLYQQALAANDNNMVGAVAAQEENQQPPN
jgi:hypothetical protein